MTSLTPLISSNFTPNAAAFMQNQTYLPVINSERPLCAVATFDVSSPPLIGQTGATFIADTSTYTNTRGWFAIQFIEPTVFDSLSSNWDGTIPTGFSFSKDHVVYGNFTGIKLVSGSVVAYKL